MPTNTSFGLLKGLVLAAASILAATPAGCGSETPSDPDAVVSVVATTTQAADLVRNVGGSRVEVQEFLTPGVDPHEYEPRPTDATAVANADAVFRSGGDLDEWLDDVIDNAGADTPVLTLIEVVDGTGAGVKEESAGSPAEELAGVDPHWWQDPTNAIAAVEAIEAALIDVDPEGAREYRRNAARYSHRLERLDAGIERCIDRVPADRRTLVTTHDSYGYFADRYGVRIVGALIPALSSEAQPSAGETATLIEQLEDEEVNAVFPESPLNASLEQAVASEAGVDVGDPLWADSLGPSGSDGATYVGALASDTEAMVAGFTGGRIACRPDV